MASGNKVIGAKVELSGTSEFNSSIKNIQNSMKTLQSESKLLANRFRDDADSAEYLRDKQQLLTQMIDKQEEKIRQYSQALETSQDNLSRCGSNVDNWRQKLADAQSELERLQNSTGTSTEEIERQQQEVEKANNGLEIAQRQYNQVENRVNSYQRELNNAQSELINLNRELDDNARSLQDAENSTNECTDSINDFGEAVGQAGEDASTFGDVLRANLTSEAITGAVTAVVDKVKEIGSAVVDTAMEFEQSSNKMAAATGATAEEMEGLEQVMMNIYNDNFGSSFEDIAETVTNLKTQFRDLDNTQLQNLAEQSYLLRDTFGAETPELIRAAKTLMDQFGISGEEAFNLIAQGYQNNLDFSGEFLDTINEYSVQYASAKLSADDFFNSLANGANSGAISLDRCADAFKEMSIRIQDGTADEALEQLNLNASEIKTQFVQGGDSAKQAMSTIKTALVGVTDETQRYTLMQTIMGTQFEDLGEKGTLAVMDLTGEISKSIDVLDQMNNVRYDDLGSALEGVKRNIVSKFVEPFSDGTDEVTGKLADLTVDIQSGGLGDALESIAESCGDMFAAFVDVASNALPLLANGLELLANNLPLVAGGITAVVVAMNYQRIADFATGIGNAVIKLADMAIQAYATGGAVGALNIAMRATPTGILIGGIAGLAAGFMVLADECENSTEGLDELTRKTREVIEVDKQLKESSKKNAEQFKEKSNKIKEEIDQDKKLIEQLYKLNDVENKSAAQKQKMSSIMDTLKQKYPNLILSINEETGCLNQQKDSILKVAEAEEKKQTLQAKREQLKTLINEEAQAEANLQQAKENAYEAVAKQGKLTEQEIQDYINLRQRCDELSDSEQGRYQKLVDKLGATDTSVQENIDKLTDMQHTYDETSEKASACGDEISTLEEDIRRHNDAVAENTGTLQENTSAYIENGDATDYMKTKELESIDTLAEVEQASRDLTQQIIEEHEKMKDSAVNSFQGQIDMFNKFESKSAESTKSIVDNFKSNEKATSDWADNLGKLQGKISDEFLQYIADMGPQAAGYVADMASMSDKELKQCQTYWEDTNRNIVEGVERGYGDAKNKVDQKLREINNAFENNIDKGKIYNDGHSTGTSFGSGMASGIESQRSSIVSKARSIAQAAASAAKSELNINSPSRVTMEIGKYFGEGLALGIEGQQKDVEVSSRKLSQKAIEGLSGINSSITKINGTNFSPKGSVIDYDKLSDSIVNSMQGLEFQVGKDGLVRLVEGCLRRAVRI